MVQGWRDRRHQHRQQQHRIRLDHLQRPARARTLRGLLRHVRPFGLRRARLRPRPVLSRLSLPRLHPASAQGNPRAGRIPARGPRMTESGAVLLALLALFVGGVSVYSRPRSLEGWGIVLCAIAILLLVGAIRL